MRFIVERAWINVIGKGWFTQTIAYSYDLSGRDLESIGKQTRENVERWLDTHSGDFQSIQDFEATLKTKRIPWKKEESEGLFNDIMFPEQD